MTDPAKLIERIYTLEQALERAEARSRVYQSMMTSTADAAIWQPLNEAIRGFLALKGAPMRKDELIELAERVERAEGLSREMDAEIAAAVRFFPKGVGFIWRHGLKPNSPEPGRVECETSLGTGGPHYKAPPYTLSLDAAVTLVPEYLAWHVSSACPRDACAAIESGDDRVPAQNCGKHAIFRTHLPNMGLFCFACVPVWCTLVHMANRGQGR